MTVTLRPESPDIPNPNDRATFVVRAYPWNLWQKADSEAANKQIAEIAGFVTAIGETGATIVLDASKARDAAQGYAKDASDASKAAADAADTTSGYRDNVQTMADTVATLAAEVADATLTLSLPLLRDVADAQGDMQGSTLYAVPPGAAEGGMRVMERLGFFEFDSASTEPADGETCIAPTVGGGRWKLLLPSWDFVMSRLYGYEIPWLQKLISTVSTNAANALAGLAGTVTALQTQVNTTNLTRCIHASASLDFPSVAATTGTQSLTIAVVGAEVGDRVALAQPAALPSGLIATARVSATDVVTVTVYNNTGSAIDPAAMAYGVTVFKG